jgi:hypothetical protein
MSQAHVSVPSNSVFTKHSAYLEPHNIKYHNHNLLYYIEWTGSALMMFHNGATVAQSLKVQSNNHTSRFNVNKA